MSNKPKGKVAKKKFSSFDELFAHQIGETVEASVKKSVNGMEKQLTGLSDRIDDLQLSMDERLDDLSKQLKTANKNTHAQFAQVRKDIAAKRAR